MVCCETSRLAAISRSVSPKADSLRISRYLVISDPPYNEFASGLMLKIIIRIASLMTGIMLPNYPESCFPKSGQVLPGSP